MVGERIKQRRVEKRLSAAELARRAEMSRGYLSELEAGLAPRPSGAVLYRVATVLGTTVADLLGEPETRPSDREVPTVLAELAEREQWPEEDVQMLARIRFRGDQPQSEDDWKFLYESIRRAVVRRDE